MSGTLYVVGTPIGNLSDFSPRAVETLRTVDFIAADIGKPDFVILEINTLPGMTPTSLLPKSPSCEGYSFESLCEKLVGEAVKRFSIRAKR